MQGKQDGMKTQDKTLYKLGEAVVRIKPVYGSFLVWEEDKDPEESDFFKSAC